MRWGDRWLWSSDAPLQRIIDVGHDHDGRTGLVRPLQGVLQTDDAAAARSPLETPNPASGQNVTRFLAPDVILRGRPCSIARVSTVFGDRWTGLIIRECFFGTKLSDDFEWRLGIAPHPVQPDASTRRHRISPARPISGLAPRHESNSRTRPRFPSHALALTAWGRWWLRHSRAEVTLKHTPSDSRSTLLGCLTCAEPIHKDQIGLPS